MQERVNSPKTMVLNSNRYSATAQQETRESLTALSAHLFIHNNRCHLKNIDTDGRQTFGCLTLKNALAANLLVEDANGGPALLYATVDDLVNDGWVVD